MGLSKELSDLWDFLLSLVKFPQKESHEKRLQKEFADFTAAQHRFKDREALREKKELEVRILREHLKAHMKNLIPSIPVLFSEDDLPEDTNFVQCVVGDRSVFLRLVSAKHFSSLHEEFVAIDSTRLPIDTARIIATVILNIYRAD